MAHAAATVGTQAPAPAWKLAEAHRVHGVGRLAYERRAGRNRIADLYHRDPMRFLFPNAAPGDIEPAVLVTTSGGLVGGDRMDLTVDVGAGTDALLLAQAAEKVYGSGGPDCRIDARFQVDIEGSLEWLPQETILFQDARLCRRTSIDVASGGRFLGGELLVFGRTSHGEVFNRGLLRDRWDVRFGGRLQWIDALRLEAASLSALDEAAGFAAARAYGLILYVGDDADTLLDVARAALPSDETVTSAATRVRDVIAVRWLSADAFALRRAYGRFWSEFRGEALNRPRQMPRLWSI